MTKNMCPRQNKFDIFHEGGSLAPEATVQSWLDPQHAVAAAQAGHDVVMSTNGNCYLNYGSQPDEGEVRDEAAIGPHCGVVSGGPNGGGRYADDRDR